MYSPYRISPAVEPLASHRSSIEMFKTRMRRKLLVWWKGSFKKRFPLRCDVCGKPSIYTGSGGDIIHVQNTYEPCGHTYKFWRQMRHARHVKNVIERDNIPLSLRKKGQWIKVENINKAYILMNGITNKDWIEFSSIKTTSGGPPR